MTTPHHMVTAHPLLPVTRRGKKAPLGRGPWPLALLAERKGDTSQPCVAKCKQRGGIPRSTGLKTEESHCWRTWGL